MTARWASVLGSLAIESTTFLHEQLEEGAEILLEGAQGALLDIDHGTFPFVTSSNSSGVGVSSGSGIPGRCITKVLGVAKAYSTRVGGGPFPTELFDDTGAKIREIGREYGTTTGRPRRCGWLDAFALRYTSRLSGVHSMALMMLDVLSHFETIQVCTGYELNGVRINRFPSRADELRACKPVYETFPGWMVDVTKVRTYDELPQATKEFVAAVESLVGVPIEILSVGPDRQQTIFVPSPNPQAVDNMFAKRKASSPSIDVPFEKRPKHVAIIMDGNGRWAQSRGLPRIEGHRRGADTVRRIIESAGELG